MGSKWDKKTRQSVSVLLTLMLVMSGLCGVTTSVRAESANRPIVKSMSFAQEQYSRPGVFNLELDLYDEDFCVTAAFVSLVCIDANSSSQNSVINGYSETGGLWVMDGKGYSTIWVDEDTELGTYLVTGVNLIDSAGRENSFAIVTVDESEVDPNDPNIYYSKSENIYYKNELIDAYGHKATGAKFTLVDDMNFSDKFSVANPKISERISKVQEGHSVGLFMDQSNVVPKSAFDAIAGRDVNIVTYAYSNGVRWVFNGKDIKNPTKDVDVSLEMNQVSGKEYGLEDDVVVLKFASNGVLPGKANVRIKSDYLYHLNSIKGDLYLLYNDNEQYVYEEGANVKLKFDGIDKWCSFDVTHNSEYVICSEKSIKKVSESYSNEWVDGKWYDADGNQSYSGTLEWKCNSAGWWVEDTANWYPVSCWQKIDGYWYYFDASGYMVSSAWQDGCWLGSDGAWTYEPAGSWKGNSSGWWFEDTSGWYPYSQWLKINGSWYYFDGSGYMVTSKYIDGYWIGADGTCQ